MDQTPDRHSNRHIVLPSGRWIEVVKPDPEIAPQHQLHICPECESTLVQPLHWREIRPGSWKLALRCPNCDWITEGLFAQHQVDQLEDQLDHGLAEMLGDLRQLTQVNMSDEINRFVAALHADVILPEDF